MVKSVVISDRLWASARLNGGVELDLRSHSRGRQTMNLNESEIIALVKFFKDKGFISGSDIDDRL